MNHIEFKQTVMPLHAEMYRAALILSGSEDDAADIVQDSMMKLWQGKERLGDVCNLRAYCLKSVRNTYLSKYAGKSAAEPISEDMADASPPDIDTDYSDTFRKYRRALAGLPAAQRQAVRLSAEGDLPNDEIADIIGTTETNVRQLLSRGRKTLRKLMGHGK